jgi:hypothetical protein
MFEIPAVLFDVKAGGPKHITNQILVFDGNVREKSVADEITPKQIEEMKKLMAADVKAAAVRAAKLAESAKLAKSLDASAKELKTTWKTESDD